MLEFFRRAAKSWAAKILIVLLIASFAVWGIGDIFSFRLDSAVAEVGESEVTAEDYANAVVRQRQAISQQAQRLISYRDLRDAGIDRQLLIAMVSEAALTEEMRRIGIDAPDEAVSEQVRRNPAFQDGPGSFSETAYLYALSREGMVPATFEAELRKDIGREILEGAVVGAGPSLPHVAERLAAWTGETRSLSILTLPLSSAAEPGTPNNAELAAYFEENAERFREPERRTGRYLLADIAALAADEPVDESAVQALYETEVDRYTTEASRELDQISFPDRPAAAAALARIEAGEIDYDGLADELGQGGEGLSLGNVQRRDLPPATADAVFAVSEPGIVGPVDTPVGGAVLLRVRDVLDSVTPSLDTLRPALEQRLANERAADKAIDIANLIEERRAGGLGFEEIAAGSGATMGSFEGLAQDGMLADGTAAEGPVAQAAFLTEAFEALDAEERDILETPDGGFLLVMVDTIAETHVPALDDIRDRVAAAWVEDQRLAALEARAEIFAPKLAGGEITLASIAAGFGGQVRETEPLGRGGAQTAGVPPTLLQDAFDAAPGETVIARVPGGLMLAQVQAVTPLAESVLVEQMAQINTVLERSISADQLAYFVRAVEGEHGAVIHPGAVDEVFLYLSGSGGYP
ncbi:MAG: SurA N-terminal domain-containing protein [Pseudomonadota bacterium]